ncbi:MAG: tetratricopeptide repeat protein [Gammaproteobacteria bacterium]|nr:tetratricopeptide repeat protein [Gammaproteobacteria bacterium]
MTSIRAVRNLAGLLLLSVVAAGAAAQSVSRATFVQLERVQELMTEENYAEARTLLEAHVVKIQKNSYDFALTSQYLAHVSVLMGDAARARLALEAALAKEDLPDELRTDMSLFYGTVLMSEEEFDLARQALEAWFAVAPLPQPNQIFTLAYANYMSGNVPRAEELVDRAIGDSTDPQESWYQLHYRTLFEQQKYERAEEVLLGMLDRAPSNPMYWRMLAGHYLHLERSTEGLASLMVAYVNGLIDSDTDLSQIVALWGFIDAPEKGARMLKALIDEGRVESNAESLKRLGNLWLMARERNDALEALTRAAELEPDGKTYELVGGIYFEEENWDSAYDAYQNAMRQGDLEDPRRVSLLAGISAYRAGDYGNARTALREAAKDVKLKPQADSILREIN